MASNNQLLGSGKVADEPAGDPRVLDKAVHMSHKDYLGNKVVYRRDVKEQLEREGWVQVK